MAKCCDFDVSKFRHRITIQSVTEASDGQGGQDLTWATDTTVWALITPASSWESMQAMQLQTPITHKVTMRYRAGLTTKNRLLYDGRVFEIKSIINPGEENFALELKCIETT